VKAVKSVIGHPLWRHAPYYQTFFRRLNRLKMGVSAGFQGT